MNGLCEGESGSFLDTPPVCVRLCATTHPSIYPLCWPPCTNGSVLQKKILSITSDFPEVISKVAYNVAHCLTFSMLVLQTPDEAEDGPPELLFIHGGHTSKVGDRICRTGQG